MSTLSESHEARIAAHAERVAGEIPAKEKSKSRKPVTKDELKAAIQKKKQEMEVLNFKMLVGENKDMLNALSNYERATKKIDRLNDSLSIDSLDDIKEDATETLEFLYERRDALDARISVHEAAASGDITAYKNALQEQRNNAVSVADTQKAALLSLCEAAGIEVPDAI